jgi:WD40 repeat protein
MSPPLRIFISSPGDVIPERRRAKLVIEKLARAYARFLEIKSDLWEYEPMLASHNFQDNISPPGDSDIVVLILWSRLGTPLPERTETREYRGIDGRSPVTGTEWEFESALAAQKQRGGVPELLAYRKTTDPVVSLKDKAAKVLAEDQWEKIEAFWSRHFVSRGQYHAAFSEFTTLDSFESKFESDVRQLIERRIQRFQDVSKPTTSVWLKGSPFRGLETFRFEDAPIFFGRTQAATNTVELLLENAERGRAFLLIVGASGAGKSSLVQAGMVPALVAPGVVPGVGLWRRAVMRPGGHRDGPFAALAEALVAKTALPELLAPGQDATALTEHLAAAASDPKFTIVATLNKITDAARQRAEILAIESARLVLVIDQLEELFTFLEITPEQRTSFIRCIDGLARSGQVFVIATIRSDYWHRAAETPLLVEMAAEKGRFDLLPAEQSEVIEMIRGPAEAAGIDFGTDPEKGIKLDATLAVEAAREPGALPLLSFLLDALYQKDIRDGKRSTLTFDSMHALGGLRGAIATRAEAAFANLPPEIQAVFPKVLRSLVTVSRSGAEPTARATSMSRFPKGGTERVIIDALLDKEVRLLVAEGDGTGARVRIAHEALISYWERAKTQIGQDRDDLRMRAAIEEAEAEWRAASPRQRRGYLLRDPHLANALDLARRWGDELAPELRAFIEQSRAATMAAARRRWTIAAAIMVCLAGLSIVSFGAFYLAESQRNEALIAQSRFLARDTQAAVASGDSTLAVLLALAALPREIRNPDRPFVRGAEDALEIATVTQRERLVLGGVDGHQDRVTALAFSPDGTRVVTASDDATARIWDSASGASIAVLRGHKGPLTAAAFSPDGTRVVTASDDKTSRIWDAASGAATAVLEGHEDHVAAVAFSPDGGRVITASWDKTARIWNAASGASIAVLRDHQGPITAVAFSPNGSRVVTASGLTARIFDAATGATTAVLLGHADRVFTAAFSPDGTRVVTGSRDKTARIWNAENGAMIKVLAGHEDHLISVAFSPDGTQVVTSSLDKTARVWDAKSGLATAVLKHDDFVVSAIFSSDGHRVVTASWDKTARIWDTASAALIAVLRGHKEPIAAVALSSDGSRVATASWDKTARIWDAVSGAAVVFRGHQAPITAAAISRDGSRMATASWDKTARIWDAASGAAVVVLNGHGDRVNAVAFSADGGRVVTASDDKTGRVWDVNSGLVKTNLSGHENRVNAAAFSPDGARIVTASDDATARIWDSASGTSIAVLRGHQGPIAAVAFSPDGTRVVTASDDATARIWNAASGASIAVLRGHKGPLTAVAFSPDGTRLVTASDDKTSRIWNAASGAATAILEGHEDHLAAAAFSPDGGRVITASWDKTARIWNAASGASIAVLRGHQGPITAVAFSPNGSRVVTSSMDKTARIWDAATGATTAVLLGHEDRVFTAAFSPDGTRVVTTSYDNDARLWHMLPQCDTLMELARKKLPPNRTDFTDTERSSYFLEPARASIFMREYNALRPWIGWALPTAGDPCP